MSKPMQKYIDKKMVTKIDAIQKEYLEKNKKCSFIKASRILAGRI